MTENPSHKTITNYSGDRRNFIKKASLGLLAMSIPVIPDIFGKDKLGIVVHSYAKRWHSSYQSSLYPGFKNASDLLNHCHKIGAGGIQVGVKGWSTDFSKNIRDQREKLGMYLEGSIGMPRKEIDLSGFEKQLTSAKEAGVKVLRTVSLGPRRYEALHTEEDFVSFKIAATRMLEKVVPILSKHKIKLAIENHKDWRADELVDLVKKISSEWIGVTLDFGNSIALMEQPEHTLQLLAPYVFTTHVKDMAVAPYEKGFQLSEVPLGEGCLALKHIVDTCKKHNPTITFNLEMITRNPLLIPCLTPGYWSTLQQVPASELAAMLTWVNAKKEKLPNISSLKPETLLAKEEYNVLTSLSYSKENLNL